MTRSSQDNATVIVGAGMGGLSSALLLAHQGVPVTVLEMGDRPGGKAGVDSFEGVEFDTGPSLLTMPDVLRSLFKTVGESMEDHLTLHRLDPAFRYLYPDGTSLDIYHDLPKTLESVRESLGSQSARELEGFMRYAAKIWEASAPEFVYGDAPTPRRLMGMSMRTLAGLRHIDASSSMWKAITSRVRSEPLRWLLARYATYNGSDVRKAPATLNCISHVELALGGFGVEGGMHKIAEVLTKLAIDRGATFHWGTRVDKIETRRNQVRRVLTNRGEFQANEVLCNADARHVYQDLLRDSRKLSRKGDYEPSMSGWNAIVKASRPEARSQLAHTVLFPENYLQEFEDIFDRQAPPTRPTLYVCNQALAHKRASWEGADPLFVMLNAPAVEGRAKAPPENQGELVLEKLRRAGLVASNDPVVWQRTPTMLAKRFPGSLGSIYGSASNSMFSAFQRPRNKSDLVEGLYLASGSAHPGGGVPLCLLSGVAAARAILQDRGQTLQGFRT